MGIRKCKREFKVNRHSQGHENKNNSMERNKSCIFLITLLKNSVMYKNSKAINYSQILRFFSSNLIGDQKTGWAYCKKQGVIHKNDGRQIQYLWSQIYFCPVDFYKTFAKLTQAYHMLRRSFCCYCFCSSNKIIHMDLTWW